jgi:hypothetical protein
MPFSRKNTIDFNDQSLSLLNALQRLNDEIDQLYTAINTTASTIKPDAVNSEKCGGYVPGDGANKIVVRNGDGNITGNITGTAYNIPTSDVGGNIWIG